VASPKGVPAHAFGTPVEYNVPDATIPGGKPVTAGVPVEPATLPRVTVGPVLVTPASPRTAKEFAVPKSIVPARALAVDHERAKAEINMGRARIIIFYPEGETR
jgi:hypothetical protein